MPEKVKILHIIKSLGRGGAEMLLPETLRLHDQSAFEFHYIYFLPWKNQMVDSIQHAGGLVTCLKSNNNIQLILQLKPLISYIRKHKIQLIHAHLPWAGILARIAGKLTKVPVIYTEHNKQERYHWITRLMNLKSLNWTSKVIAVSSDVEGSIHKYKPGLKASIETIVNGVDVRKFSRNSIESTDIRSRYKIPADAPLVGTIAVFRFQKRLDTWLEIAKKILAARNDAHFIIVGDGPLKNNLVAKRAELGLENRIHMPGIETEVRPYLMAFNLYMMSSVFEGLPVALLEAMAMECPIVSTDAGGIKEVVRHESEGLLCPVDKPYELAGFAITLLGNPELRIKYGTQARKRVIEGFSMEQMVTKLEHVYRETLAMTD